MHAYQIRYTSFHDMMGCWIRDTCTTILINCITGSTNYSQFFCNINVLIMAEVSTMISGNVANLEEVSISCI